MMAEKSKRQNFALDTDQHNRSRISLNERNKRDNQRIKLEEEETMLSQDARLKRQYESDKKEKRHHQIEIIRSQNNELIKFK